MDYDTTAMPSAYDAGRGYAPAVLDFWLRILSSAVGQGRVDDILDLGCGTGRYSAALAAHFGTRVVGLDPSGKMLAEAARKGGDRVRFVRGTGEAMPLADGAFDMVFISMVFHHFESPRRAARECRRVLRDKGTVCLRAATSDRIDDYAYVPFFPGTRSLLRKDLQTLAFIQGTFADAGFARIHHRVVDSRAADSWQAYAEKIAHRADSILAQLTDAEFADGLAAVRAHARARPATEPVVEPIDFLVFRAA